MKRAGVNFLLILTIIIAFAACAKRGTPDGGPRDMEPPRYVRAKPENFTTSFDADEIRIYFNEYVKLTNPQQQIIISPPMDPRPEITPLGTASKSIRIRINDTLQPRTTYTINFGRSITDNNESNPLSFFTYAFSTGPYIDSLSLRGSVKDAILRAPDPFISVMLYEVDSTYSDSVIYTRVPRYVTNTLDSATTFQLNNLKQGTYQLVAMRDVNNNYTFEPRTDKVAFSDEYITIPTDEEFDLTLFTEILEGKFERPQLKSQQHLIFGYTGLILADSISITPLDVPASFEDRITKDAATDTLHYWYKPYAERDTLKFLVETPRMSDTVIARLRNAKRDTLLFNVEPKSSLGFQEDLNIIPTVPLEQINDSLISLTRSDSTSVPFTGTYDRWNNVYRLSFDKSEKQKYQLLALPGAFTDFFGRQNDTITAQASTPALAERGNVIVNLTGVEDFPVIVQVTSEKGEVIAEEYSTGSNVINFNNLKPGSYLLRLIYDRNENNIWDTGSFLKRKQPEVVVYYPEPISVRANWDDNYTFNASPAAAIPRSDVP
ncbi:Ig-like domain-containing protein [Salinimicrobium tongyeongense]|uniref:Ig-like domain-containing protein n=1 Tax=Salinimicrobium tongyeongense TaxID=2809707 RepID=A0ABY6NU71_9FLAO|nr:Ig-like domain-containing protein [Salinimicrobium tongyeongense]UZH56442.1 Ig-like domain-containing protein [Salinimicrobium tongyeongense]